MKTFDKKIQKMITSYEVDLKNFLSKNNLDATLADDIMERVHEKLAKKENPTISDVTHIFAEIGTPEEIFADEIMEERPLYASQKKMTLWQRFQNKTNGVVFLGVFYTLAEITNIPANVFRLVFFSLLMAGFLIHGTIIPVLVFFYFLGFLLLRTGFFRFAFSLFVALFCGVLLVPSVMLFGLYLGNFRLDNVHIFSEFPVFFPIGMIIGIFSLIVFVVYFIRYAFFGKSFGIRFFLTGLVSFIVAILFGVATIVHLMGVYFVDPKVVNYEASVDISKIENPIYLGHLDNTPHKGVFGPISIGPIFKGINRFTVEASTENLMYVSVQNKIFGSNDLFERTKNYIQGITLTKNSYGQIDVTIQKDTKNVYPFAPSVVELTHIKIPIGKRFYAKHWELRDVDFAEIIFPDMEKFSEKQRYTIGKMCEQYFFDENKKLNCDISYDRAIKEIKRGYYTYSRVRSEVYRIANKYDFQGRIRDLVSEYGDVCEYNCKNHKFDNGRKFYIAPDNLDGSNVLYIIPESEKNIFENVFESLPGEKTTDALERFFQEKIKTTK